ncbi:hypothetical protein PanWU01x14_155340 [Parasponia andersonii]|uniref:Uncharacterized protein n=1 Tax=Parasponia andersonii TaxID=3476 RepID=A0A2P5CG40_PARAD|nr:hypothetical protein PanWU01x14_155340 [Parasponia andersonii]
MLPEAKHDKLQNVIGSSSKPDDAASPNSPGTSHICYYHFYL